MFTSVLTAIQWQPAHPLERILWIRVRITKFFRRAAVMRIVPGLRCISIFLIFNIFSLNAAKASDLPINAASAKLQLEKRGVGKMVKVKEEDGKEVRARIVSLGETSAVLQADSKSTIEIPYDKMAAVKGPGLSKAVKITIGVVAAVWIGLAIVGTRI